MHRYKIGILSAVLLAGCGSESNGDKVVVPPSDIEAPPVVDPEPKTSILDVYATLQSEMLQIGNDHNIIEIDLGADGDLDVIKFDLGPGWESPGPLHIFRNDGDNFVYVETDVEAYFRTWHVADFNGDGLDDIYFADHGIDRPPFPGAQNKMLFQTEDSNFVDVTEAHVPQMLTFDHGTSVSDFNRDGYPDIIASQAGGDFNLFMNDGTGKLLLENHRLPLSYINTNEIMDRVCEFEDCRNYPYDWNPFYGLNYTWNTSGDVTGDGYDDIILVADFREDAMDGYRNSVHDKKIIILENDGTGHFTYDYSDALSTDLGRMGSIGANVTDVNQDGHNDILVIRAEGVVEHLVVHLNNGDGTFTSSIDQSTYHYDPAPEGECCGHTDWMYTLDYNQDGYPDVLFGTLGHKVAKKELQNNFSRLFINNTDGTFTVLSNPETHEHLSFVEWMNIENNIK